MIDRYPTRPPSLYSILYRAHRIAIIFSSTNPSSFFAEAQASSAAARAQKQKLSVVICAFSEHSPIYKPFTIIMNRPPPWPFPPLGQFPSAVAASSSAMSATSSSSSVMPGPYLRPPPIFGRKNTVGSDCLVRPVPRFGRAGAVSVCLSTALRQTDTAPLGGVAIARQPLDSMSSRTPSNLDSTLDEPQERTVLAAGTRTQGSASTFGVSRKPVGSALARGYGYAPLTRTGGVWQIALPEEQERLLHRGAVTGGAPSGAPGGVPGGVSSGASGGALSGAPRSGLEEVSRQRGERSCGSSRSLAAAGKTGPLRGAARAQNSPRGALEGNQASGAYPTLFTPPCSRSPTASLARPRTPSSPSWSPASSEKSPRLAARTSGAPGGERSCASSRSPKKRALFLDPDPSTTLSEPSAVPRGDRPRGVTERSRTAAGEERTVGVDVGRRSNELDGEAEQGRCDRNPDSMTHRQVKSGTTAAIAVPPGVSVPRSRDDIMSEQVLVGGREGGMESVVHQIPVALLDATEKPKTGDLISVKLSVAAQLQPDGSLRLDSGERELERILAQLQQPPKVEMSYLHATTGQGWAETAGLRGAKIVLTGWKGGRKFIRQRGGTAGLAAVDISGNNEPVTPGALQITSTDRQPTDLTATFTVSLPFIRDALLHGKEVLVVCRAGEKRSCGTIIGLVLWGMRYMERDLRRMCRALLTLRPVADADFFYPHLDRFARRLRGERMPAEARILRAEPKNRSVHYLEWVPSALVRPSMQRQAVVVMVGSSWLVAGRGTVASGATAEEERKLVENLHKVQCGWEQLGFFVTGIQCTTEQDALEQLGLK